MIFETCQVCRGRGRVISRPPDPARLVLLQPVFDSAAAAYFSILIERHTGKRLGVTENRPTERAALEAGLDLAISLPGRYLVEGVDPAFKRDQEGDE